MTLTYEQQVFSWASGHYLSEEVDATFFKLDDDAQFKFLEGYEEREKARWDKNYIDTDAERDVQNRYSDVSEKWNKTH